MKLKSLFAFFLTAIIDLLCYVAAFVVVHFIEPLRRKKGYVQNTITKVNTFSVNAKAWLYAFMARWHDDGINLISK